MSEQKKYALITGASSGIGRCIAGELAERGFSIVAVSNQPELLVTLKTDLESSFLISVVTLAIDLAHENSAKEVFDFCESSHLEIEVLVNNAGILVMGEAAKVEFGEAVAILQLHVTTPALLCRLFGRKMIERKHGYILNMSSISAAMPYPTISFYGPTKTFGRSFTRALRTEMRPYGIHVTCLLPGAVATSLYDSHKVDIPLALKWGVMKQPEEVARAGVKALFSGKAECVPGLLNKLVMRIVPFIPHFIISWIYRKRIEV